MVMVRDSAPRRCPRKRSRCSHFVRYGAKRMTWRLGNEKMQAFFHNTRLLCCCEPSCRWVGGGATKQSFCVFSDGKFLLLREAELVVSKHWLVFANTKYVGKGLREFPLRHTVLYPLGTSHPGLRAGISPPQP